MDPGRHPEDAGTPPKVRTPARAARGLRVGLVAQRYMSLMLTIFADDPGIV